MRLIDADALIKCIEDLPNCYNGFSDTYDKSCIIEVIDEQPTAQTKNVKRGRWLSHPSEPEYDVCSACGCGVKRREYGVTDGRAWMEELSYQFCPWCGAKLERREEC